MARVLALAQSSELGGAELALLRIARRLPAHGFEMWLATPGDGPLAEAAGEAGIPVRRVQVGGLSRRSWAGLARGLPQARRLVRRLAPDLVYLNGAVTLRAWPALHGATLVPHLHDLVVKPPRPWASDRFWRATPAVMCAAGAVVESAEAAGAPRDRLRDVGAPVALAPPAPRPAWARGGPVIGFVGRIEPAKGVLDLLEAAPAVLDRHPDARLVLAGGPSLQADLGYSAQVNAARADFGESVVVLGPVPDATALMPWFDVLAMPSLKEAFGTVAAEALAAGTPVVVSDRGGMKEYVTDRCGAVVPASNPTALAAALLGVLDRAPRMADAAREAAAPFAADRVAAGVAAVLDEALAAHGRA